MEEKNVSVKRRAYVGLMKCLMWLSAGLTCLLVLFLISYVLYKGLPNITWELLSTSPSYLADSIGILPDLMNTLYIVIATILIVVPLGVGAAIYLTEYASNKRVVNAIEYAAETLSGIPSIIYGLVGMLFFCRFCKMGTSLMAGALTLVIMNLPTVMRTTQESLKTVPQSYREGAFGLGRRQMARDTHSSASRLYGRRYYRLHTGRRTHTWRIGGAAVYGRSCPYAPRLLLRPWQLRCYAYCRPLRIRKGAR